MLLRRLLAFFLRITREKKDVKQDLVLLDLPLELLYAIFNELQLPEKILLSQTCRVLWDALRCRCSLAMRQATADERLDCLSVLGYILPDHRLCTCCHALHLLGPQDIPITVAGEVDLRTLCPSKEPEPVLSGHRLDFYYPIAFYQVQLAIKYTRLKDIHQDYLAYILQKFTVSMNWYRSGKLNISVEPVIVRGRFLLMATHVICGIEKPTSSSFSPSWLAICPHRCTGTLYGGSPLSIAIRSAFNVAESRRSLSPELHSCDRCPTDYSVAVKDRRVTISVWQDLGTGISPKDPYWRSHTLSYVNNDVYAGTKFDYEHGSIRDLYYSKDTGL